MSQLEAAPEDARHLLLWIYRLHIVQVLGTIDTKKGKCLLINCKNMTPTEEEKTMTTNLEPGETSPEFRRIIRSTGDGLRDSLYY
jgi:hypothetical protein